MNRRNILKRLGAGAAALAVGTTAASANEDGEPELQAIHPETGDVVTLSDECICYDGCYSGCCPCDICLC